jgi:hypothetical protein
MNQEHKNGKQKFHPSAIAKISHTRCTNELVRDSRNSFVYQQLNGLPTRKPAGA